jgi:hypothetical protein
VLTDPQAVTISGNARTLPRLEDRPETSVYSDRANGVDLFVTQKVDKNGTNRSSVSLVRTAVVTDPLTDVKSQRPVSISISATIPVGFVIADAEALYVALTASLSASTNALLKRVLAGER